MSGLQSLFVAIAFLVLSATYGSFPVRAHAGSSPQPEPPATSPPRCSAELRLVGSVVNERRPERSLAVLRNRAGARVVAIGGQLDGLVLTELRPHYAALRSASGESCVLPVFDVARTLAQPEESAPPRPSAGREGKPAEDAEPREKARPMFSRDELAHGLRTTGRGEYSLAQPLLLKALRNPGGALAGAHFRMVERAGQPLGMELRGVRDGSPLAHMGLRAGDVVRSINGIDVSTASGLLDLLRTVRSAKALTLSIVREGQERALHYRVE